MPQNCEETLVAAQLGLVVVEEQPALTIPALPASSSACTLSLSHRSNENSALLPLDVSTARPLSTLGAPPSPTTERPLHQAGTIKPYVASHPLSRQLLMGDRHRPPSSYRRAAQPNLIRLGRLRLDSIQDVSLGSIYLFSPNPLWTLSPWKGLSKKISKLLATALTLVSAIFHSEKRGKLGQAFDGRWEGGLRINSTFFSGSFKGSRGWGKDRCWWKPGYSYRLLEGAGILSSRRKGSK